jgi:hypothetical protein
MTPSWDEQLGNQTGPTSLVRGSQAPACVSMKVLMKQQVIAEVRVVL